jgi:hypothetical protein
VIGGIRTTVPLLATFFLVVVGSVTPALPARQGLAASPALVGVDATRRQALSLPELRAMPWTKVATKNLFNDKIVEYRGPLMRDVLARIGLSDARSVVLVAANDYSVEIPTVDFRDWDVIVAMEADGDPLSPRETGPLWLIYPQTGHPELEGSIYAQRLIWQLVQVEAR